MGVASGPTARLFGMPSTATTATHAGFNCGLVRNRYELTHTAVPMLASAQTPQIGHDFPVKLSQAPPLSAAGILFGMSKSGWSGMALPFDLAPLNAQGCSLLASVSSPAIKTVKSDANAKYTYRIPQQLNLIGLHFDNQWAVYEPTVNPFGFEFTNAGEGVI